MSKTIQEILAEKDAEIAHLRPPADALAFLTSHGNRMYGWVAEWSKTGATTLVLRQSTGESPSETPQRAIEKLKAFATSGI